MFFKALYRKSFHIFGLFLISSCTNLNNVEINKSQDIFYKNLSSLCGKAFSGQMVSNDKQDGDILNQELVMHIRNCNVEKIEIPFNVGENRSRTWVIRKFTNKIELKHNHVHEDGSLDNSTFYGGETKNIGTKVRQEFPADEYSKILFDKNNIPNSKNNIWAIEIIPNKIFAYELKRENRFFRVEFDLTKEINPPKPSWGYVLNSKE